MDARSHEYLMIVAVNKRTNAMCRYLLEEKAVEKLPNGSLVMGYVSKVRCQACGVVRWDDGTKCKGEVKETFKGITLTRVCDSYYMEGVGVYGEDEAVG